MVGPRLFTISGLGVKANALAGLADRGWAAFPQPPAPPCGTVPMPEVAPGQPQPSIAPCPIPMPIR